MLLSSTERIPVNIYNYCKEKVTTAYIGSQTDLNLQELGRIESKQTNMSVDETLNQSAELQQEVLTCTICSEEFPLLDQLEFHLDTIHNVQREISPVDKLLLSNCSETSTSLSSQAKSLQGPSSENL